MWKGSGRCGVAGLTDGTWKHFIGRGCYGLCGCGRRGGVCCVCSSSRSGEVMVPVVAVG